MKSTRLFLAALVFSMLTACSLLEVQNTTNVALLATQAANQFPVVEARLREDAGLYTEEEKYALNLIADRVEIIRDAMQAIYNRDGMEGLKAGGQLLVSYQELRTLYIQAIRIVENKIEYMDIHAAMDVRWHIKTVRDLDRNIQKLVASNQNDRSTLKATIDLLTIVAKMALVAGA